MLPEDQLGERPLTDSAARLVNQIFERASDRGMHALDSGSVVILALWALIRWERKVGLAALERMEVDVPALAHDVDVLLDQIRDENPTARRNGVLVYRNSGEPVLRMSRESLLEPLLTAAEQESKSLGHNWTGTEHLLLAVIRTAGPELSNMLARHTVAHERSRNAIVELLRG